MLLHLSSELACDLDRAHLGAEGAAKRAFNEVGDLALEVAQEAHERERRGWWLLMLRKSRLGIPATHCAPSCNHGGRDGECERRDGAG